MTLRPETRARARALQVLYAWETDRRPPPEVLLGLLQRLTGEKSEVRERADRLVRGVVTEWETLDDTYGRAAEHWRIDRMAVVDRNILRMAVYELIHDLAPPKVVIDEALWLAHRFGGLQSAAFVNGVLDLVARTLGRL